MWSSTLAVVFPNLNSSDVWDREYARGDWDRMNADSEFGRYALVFAHVARMGGKPSVLDVGCGAGRLATMITSVDYDQYMGVDLSTEAVQRARALGVERTSFAVEWAQEFDTERRFDAIVFNEVLYYLPNPLEVLTRYQGLLKPGGQLIVSMYTCFSAWLIWRKLAKQFTTSHAARVTNQLRHSWDVRVLSAR